MAGRGQVENSGARTTDLVRRGVVVTEMRESASGGVLLGSQRSRDYRDPGDALFVGQVMETASMMYRERFLVRRYGIDPIPVSISE